jgi:hypothetical protein
MKVTIPGAICKILHLEGQFVSRNYGRISISPDRFVIVSFFAGFESTGNLALNKDLSGVRFANLHLRSLD